MVCPHEDDDEPQEKALILGEGDEDGARSASPGEVAAQVQIGASSGP